MLDVDTSNFAAKKDLITLKAEVDKLGINKFVNVPTGLSTVKTKEDDLNVENCSCGYEKLKWCSESRSC